MQVEINRKLCPITFGMPTKMTEKGFKRSCLEMQREIIRVHRGAMNSRTINCACTVCKGMHKPAELEIMTLAEITAGMMKQLLKIRK